jgi:hypothetical protein
MRLVESTPRSMLSRYSVFHMRVHADVINARVDRAAVAVIAIVGVVAALRNRRKHANAVYAGIARAWIPIVANSRKMEAFKIDAGVERAGIAVVGRRALALTRWRDRDGHVGLDLGFTEDAVVDAYVVDRADEVLAAPDGVATDAQGVGRRGDGRLDRSRLGISNCEFP